VEQIPSDGSSAWLSRAAIPFDLESAATGPLYVDLREFTDGLIKQAYKETRNFTHVSAPWIRSNPHLLPVLTHVAGLFSKEGLSKAVGSVSDRSVSVPAARRLETLLSTLGTNRVPKVSQVKERIKATTEGIVRDLVGRLLLEQFVAEALATAGVPFKREEEYESLGGVVYDFRADFVIPDAAAPKAFVEVRKSSSRHASLYAKDKMFSAINWKGKHPECLGVLAVDGPWTQTSLEIMARVFDYVIPISQCAEVAARIRDYIDGDRTVLRWLIHFRIDKLGQ
jgi:hypothetical protein